MRRCVAAPWWLALALAGLAAESLAGDVAAAFRARRETIEREHADQVQACQQQFAVSPCVTQARLQRRDALVSLEREQAQAQQVERSHAPARRRQATMEPVQGAAVPPRAVVRTRPVPAPAAADAMSDSAQAPAHGAAVRHSRPPKASGHAPAAPAASRRAHEQQAMAAWERREAQARAHADAVRQREARRAARGAAPAAPLPPASGAVSTAR